MADAEALEVLKRGADEWNRWRGARRFARVDLSGASLAKRKLNDYSFLRADLSRANLAGAQLENAHLKEADLTGAILTDADLGAVNAREAIFNDVIATHANFEVSTLRGAQFRGAKLATARFHRAYLRDTDLSGADLSGAWMRFATLEGARCEQTTFTGADLRYATMVGANLAGADLTDVHVFGLSAWNVRTDEKTRQNLIVSVQPDTDTPLRAHDLQTAQLLALMLDGDGVRRVFDSVNSSLALILGSFSPAEKPALDLLRNELQRRGYVAVTFDFARPAERDYAETILTLAGMARFVVADFTNAKEVRAEVLQVRNQFRRVPIIPIAQAGAPLPVTMANVFAPEELEALVRYSDLADLAAKVGPGIVDPAKARAARVAESLRKSEALLRGQ